MSAARIFISYRRDDVPAAAGRLADHLARHFRSDRVFFDTKDIGGGRRFESEIFPALEAAVVVLAVIGPNWAGRQARRRRIDEDHDWVRRELLYSLEGGKLVVPVVVERETSGITTDLPKLLGPLGSRRAVLLRHAAWEQDCRELVGIVSSAIYATRTTTKPRRRKPVSGEGRGVLNAMADAVTSLDWGAGHGRVAIAHSDGAVRTTSPIGGQRQTTSTQHFSDEYVLSLRWSPNDGTLALAAAHHLLIVAGPAHDPPLKMRMPVQDLANVIWHPRGDRIAGASYDGRGVVLVPATRQVHTLEPPEAGSTDPPELVGVVWMGDALSAARADGTVLTWSSPRESSTHVAHDGVITSVDWCPSRRMLATSGTDDTVLVADRRGGLARLRCDDTPMVVRWHPSGDRLAVGLGDGRVLVWDHRGERAQWDRQAHPSCCSCVAWSPHGDLLLTGGDDGAVRQWKPTL